MTDLERGNPLRVYDEQEFIPGEAPDYQTQVDQAFSAQDYGRIALLQRVQPNLSPSLDLAQPRYDQVIQDWSVKKGASLHDALMIRRAVKVPLDQSTALQVFEQLFTKYEAEREILSKLELLIETTSIKIPPALVQSKYQYLLRHENSFFRLPLDEVIRNIQGLTGIAPDRTILHELILEGDLKIAKKVTRFLGIQFTSEMGEEAFANAVRKGVKIDAHWIEDNGFLPPEDVVQAAYQSLLQSSTKESANWFRAIQELQRVTNIVPHFTEEDAFGVYQYYLDRKRYGTNFEDSLERVIKLTNIPLAESLAYQELLTIIAETLKNKLGSETIQKRFAILEKLVGHKIEVDTTDIQQAYQHAIEASIPSLVISLFDTFGIKPNVSEEVAQEFLFQFVGKTFFGHSVDHMEKLEKVFGIQLHVQSEVVQARYRQAIQEKHFSEVQRVSVATGEKPPSDELRKAILSHAVEKIQNTDSNFNTKWADEIKNLLNTFELAFDSGEVKQLFEQCFDESNVQVRKIKEIRAFTEKDLFSDLAQRAYLIIVTKKASFAINPVSLFTDIYEVSGHEKPHLAPTILQDFYFRLLTGEGYRHHKADKAGIQTIAELAGVLPIFPLEKMKTAYLEAINSINPQLIKDIQEISGVELVVDAETEHVFHDAIQSYLLEIANEEHFNGHTGRIFMELVSLVGIAIDEEIVFEICRDILIKSEDRFSEKIQFIRQITKLEISFDSPFLQDIAKRLLSDGKTRKLQELIGLGNFTLDAEFILASYDLLLTRLKNNDDDYISDWLGKFERVQKMFGVSPTKEQALVIARHLQEDREYISSRSGNKPFAVYELLKKELGIELTELFAEGVMEMIERGDFHEIERLKEKHTFSFDLPRELVLAQGDSLLKTGKLHVVEKMMQLLELDYVPLSEAAVIEAYRTCLQTQDFGDRYFYNIYQLTHLKPDFSAEEISQAYRKILRNDYHRDYSQFQEIIGVPPTQADLLSLVEYILNSHYPLVEEMQLFIANNTLDIPQKLVDTILLKKLEKEDKISKYLELEGVVREVTGKTLQLSVEVAKYHARRFLLSSPRDSGSVGSSVRNIFLWYEEITGERPFPELISLAYVKTFDQQIYAKEFKRTHLSRTVRNSPFSSSEYLSYWEWLDSEYSAPTPETAQMVFLSLLLGENTWPAKLASSINEVIQFTHQKPDLRLMVENGSMIEKSETVETLTTILQEIYRERFHGGDISSIQDLEKAFSIPFTIKPQEVQDLYLELILGECENKPVLFDLLLETTHTYPRPEIIGAVLRENIENLETLSDIFGERENIFDLVMSNAPEILQSIVRNFAIHDFSELSIFVKKHRSYFEYVLRRPDQTILLTSDDFHKLNQFFSRDLLILELAKRQGLSLEAITDEQYPTLVTELGSSHPDWDDQQIVLEPFMRGAATFGYKRMFEYLNREGLTVHDAVHAIDEIFELYQISRLSPDQFYNNILQQVQRDDRTYDEGTAHHHLNMLAQNVNRKVAEVIQRAQKYSDIDYLKDLVATLSTPEAVFSSWNNLKRYSQLEQMLGQTRMLGELKELKDKGKHRLYQYVSSLAFHPTSKVDMQAVMQFWRRPYDFLGRYASHTPEEIQNRKKPSNYIHIPHLDLSATGLRDALVEGYMDAIQAFNPLEITYEIPIVEGKMITNLTELVHIALGSRKKNIEGRARNVKKLFHEIKTILTIKGYTIQQLVEGQIISFDEEFEQQLIDIIFDPQSGLNVQWQTIVSQIHLKSDPIGVLAGNDTANCMPFGDGKNTVYTFNLNTAQMTVQAQRPDGWKRTIAQSVLTKDKDVGMPVPILLKKMQAGNEPLADILPQTALTIGDAILACDNVEVAPNWQGDYEKVIEAVYRDFLSEYMNRFGDQQKFNQRRVVIGQGYTDAMTHLPEESNNSIPLAPVSYSDKKGDNVYILNLEKESKGRAFKRKVRIVEPLLPKFEDIRPSISGVDLLSYEDSLAVGYLEGKAYKDNPVLMQYLHNMENALIAMHINNALKERPNMSLKYVDPSGIMRGYVLAYEGALEADEERDNDDYTDDEQQREVMGEKVLYISDLASDRENSMVGGRLIKGFIELYTLNYLNNGNMMPIFMQAREQTSYRIVQRQLDKVGANLGITFEMEELDSYREGGDTMHPIMLRPMQRKG